MFGTASDEAGVGRSMGGHSIGHRSHVSEAATEWRSFEQLETGTPSTSPLYWDMDEDGDFGPKPSELYGKYTWTIEKFSQINKRELRSKEFEVGGYKWYILIYPQGCDVFNHLSLFLCVANHDKLLPGWSHFAQFTISVVNKDPKKSKYSDTLHRFWKKEHDWGWKKFMELSKVLDGFIDGDTLIIKAQVQVIREKADRPFRCLDCQYRRELVRVYLANVETICTKFLDERRRKLVLLIDDKAKWSSFRTFWLAVDQNSKRRMSKEKSDIILKLVVKHFFIEKEVTSTLVMDSLYSGMRALEGQTKSKKGKAKVVEVEEMPNPIVGVEKDMFFLVDDVLVLIQRAALEPLPPKREKAPQTRMKDGDSGEEFNQAAIEGDEKYLTELFRRTMEVFVLAHIFSNNIEVAYQEAVALRRQEELIREEEAAWQAEGELKAKRSAAEKEKKSKKKQKAKQKKNNHKGNDKGKVEKSRFEVQDKHDEEDVDDMTEFITDEVQPEVEKPDIPEDISDIIDAIVCVAEAIGVNSDDRDTRHVNWDTDASEIHPPAEANNGGFVGLSSVQSGAGERKSASLMDDSSSTCSTDSVPSVVINGPYKGNSTTQYKTQRSPVREKKQDSKGTSEGSKWANETDNRPSERASDANHHNDHSRSCKASESESETVVHSLQDRIKWLEQHVVKKEEEVVSLQKKLNVKEKKTPVPSCPISPSRNPPCPVPLQSESKIRADPVLLKRSNSNTPQQSDKAAPLVTSLQNMVLAKPNNQNTSTSKSKPPTQQFTSVSRPSSAPTVPVAKPNVLVASNVQADPLLSRSASAVGWFGPNPSLETTSNVHHRSYKNATMGNNGASTSSSFTASSPPLYNIQPSVLASAPMYIPQNSIELGYSMAMDTLNPIHHQPHHHMNDYPRREMGVNQILQRGSPSSVNNNIQNMDFISSLNCTASSDDFPHLDIINDLLEDEQSSSIDQRGPQSMFRNFSFPQANPHPLRYANGGQVGSANHNQWQMPGSDWPIHGIQITEGDGYSYQIPVYSNPIPNYNGYTVFRPTNGN